MGDLDERDAEDRGAEQYHRERIAEQARREFDPGGDEDGRFDFGDSAFDEVPEEAK